MVSLSNTPTACIGKAPQVSLIDDVVSVRGDAANAVGGNLYNDMHRLIMTLIPNPEVWKILRGSTLYQLHSMTRMYEVVYMPISQSSFCILI